MPRPSSNERSYYVPSPHEIESFLQSMKSENSIKSTTNAMAILTDYKLKAYKNNEPFETMDKSEFVNLLLCFFQSIKKADGTEYEPSSLKTMFYGIKRHMIDILKLDLSEYDMKRVTSHIGASCKKLRQNGKGNFPNAASDLTAAEVQLLFERDVAGKHSPLALRNAMVIFCLILGRRARSELLW